MQSPTQQRGHTAEICATTFLEKKGFSLIEKNFYCRLGEIDLIMKDNTFLVFIEVRLRNNPNYGSALATITPRKQKKIIRSAQYYLQTHPQYQKLPCRFDVIGINAQQQLTWIPAAFEASAY